MTSPMMTKFFVKMSIHILYSPAKFHFEIQTLLKVMEKYFREGLMKRDRIIPSLSILMKAAHIVI